MSYTENGAVKYTTTNSKVYDLFALGGAYRNRSYQDRINLFADAWGENSELALKCLFYLRDVRGGQGERLFFRQVFCQLINSDILTEEQVMYLISLVPEYGRWDDVVYIYDNISLKTIKTKISELLHEVLLSDVESRTPSLLAKWMPSETASDKNQKKLAATFAKEFGLSKKNYRKLLSKLRNKINIVEKLMTEGRWEDIEFDKLPSKAGLKYRKAFMKNAAKRYAEFINSEHTTVNSRTLYPYEITHQVDSTGECESVSRKSLQKYWENLPNYIPEGKSAICVCDTSGSMWGRPIEVSTSLGIYCAERLKGDFQDMFITFSRNPKVQKIHGKDIWEKCHNLEKADWGMNTDLEAVFDLLYEVAMESNKEDIPDTIIVISDMEIDYATRNVSTRSLETTMQSIMSKWRNAGLKVPHVIYWNVNARNDTILDRGENITCVSGFSATTFEMVLKDKSGIDLMLDKLNSERYSKVDIK